MNKKVLDDSSRGQVASGLSSRIYVGQTKSFVLFCLYSRCCSRQSDGEHHKRSPYSASREHRLLFFRSIGSKDTFEKAAELHDSAQGHVYHILRTLRLNLAQPSHLISHYRSFTSLHLSAIIPRLHTPDMPKANKAVKEEDSKPYIQPEGKKAQKSPQKNSEGPWTPDQAWLLFNALYKKGKPNRLAPFSARQTLPAIRIVKLTAVRFCYADKVDWKMVSEAVGRSSKVIWGSIRRKLSEQ